MMEFKKLLPEVMTYGFGRLGDDFNEPMLASSPTLLQALLIAMLGGKGLDDLHHVGLFCPAGYFSL